MSTTTEKPPRKFPPPCWTQDEALALIDAYRERWYALRRGYLRTADWDSVADAVGRRFPDASPAKTSAQCRHKMEKLRQRYRAEKQRSLAYPGSYYSSWFFFDNMDAMDNGSSSTVGPTVETDDRIESGSGSRLKALIDGSLIPVRINSNIDGNLQPNPGFEHHDSDAVDKFLVRGLGDPNSVTSGLRAKNRSKIDGKSSPNFGSRVLNGYSSYMDTGSDKDAEDGIDFGGGFRVKASIDENSLPPGFRAKKFGNFYENLKPKFEFHPGGRDPDLVPTRSRSKKLRKIDGKFNPQFDSDDSSCHRIDADGEIWVKIPSDRSSVPQASKAKKLRKIDGNANPNVGCRVSNGFSSSSGLGFGMKSDGGGFKRERKGGVAEMVASIKLLGEGYVKTEKMKMEMALEMEQMRMQMEMKRNELVLDSQKQIVDAFVKGFLEIKKKNVRTTVSQE